MVTLAVTEPSESVPSADREAVMAPVAPLAAAAVDVTVMVNSNSWVEESELLAMGHVVVEPATVHPAADGNDAVATPARPLKSKATTPFVYGPVANTSACTARAEAA